MRMAYLSYPYSDNPQRRTEEVKALATRLVKNYRDIVLIVPHIAFDQLLSFFIEQRTWWQFIHDWEYEAISRCDLFILGCNPDPEVSSGMLWEWAFAKRLGKQIVTAEELLN